MADASLYDFEKLRCPVLKAQDLIPTTKSKPKAKKSVAPKEHVDNEAGNRRQKIERSRRVQNQLSRVPVVRKKISPSTSGYVSIDRSKRNVKERGGRGGD